MSCDGSPWPLASPLPRGEMFSGSGRARLQSGCAEHYQNKYESVYFPLLYNTFWTSSSLSEMHVLFNLMAESE